MNRVFLKKLSCLLIIVMLFVQIPYIASADMAYPEITAVQNDTGTFISMNGEIICELEENRYLRFRATDEDDNWVGCERKGADLCIGFSDAGVKGIVVESAVFTDNPDEGWFEIAISGYKDGLDCNVDYSVKGIWMPEVGKFRYTYTTSMDANLEKWYENSNVAKNYYNNNPKGTAPIEITDYHIENIAYSDIYQSETYTEMPLRYEYFLYSSDGSTNWEKFPKVHVPYVTRSGDYITIRKNGDRCYEGAKFGFTDSEHGGWMSTITETTGGIFFELCWYFFDVHMIMNKAVPTRGSAERFEIKFSMDFDPLSAQEGNELTANATERSWRELDEYAIPIFERTNDFATLISDESIPSEETAEYYIWWASSFDCFRDDTVGYDDSYSVSIKRDGTNAMPDAWYAQCWGDPWETEGIKGHKYRLSAMVKTENAGEVRLAYGVQKNNADLIYGTGTHLADGTPREDVVSWVYSDSVSGTNDWTPLSVEFVVNNNVNSVGLEHYGAGQSWFDNVVIEDLGEVTADDYYVYDDFENNKVGDWAAGGSGTLKAENGALVFGMGESNTAVAKATKTVTSHGGRWIAEMDATINTKRGTILAAANVFNLEVSGSTFQAKTGNSAYTRVDTNFEKSYVTGTPVSFKFVMDFDTKAFELWYNGSKVDLGEGNYIRSGSVSALVPFIMQINANYTGDITVDRFMLYPDTDKGSVNISREALEIDETMLYKENVQLPKEGINGASVSWHSSNPSVIDSDGKVFRGDTTGYATLTGTISKNSVSSRKSFVLRTLPYAGLMFKADSVITGATATTAVVRTSDDSVHSYDAPIVIMACYKGDDLAAADMCKVTLEDEEHTYTLSAEHTGTVDRVELFLWEEKSLKPVCNSLSYGFEATNRLEFASVSADVGEAVGFEVYTEQSGIKTPLEKGTYELRCDGMTVDYDSCRAVFATAGIKNVNLVTDAGMSAGVILVNNPDETASVMGGAVFESDFGADGAINTYTSTAGAYTIENINGTPMLATKSTSATHDTLLFGPELTDYAVEMEYNMVKPIAVGADAIGIAMRAKSANDRSSYRAGFMERSKFGGDTVLYNRLALGRAKGSNISDTWHYAQYSDNAITHARNTFYKMKASICDGVFAMSLYDTNGNLISSEEVTTAECDYNKDGTAATALASGKTVIYYHGLQAYIKDIKIYEFEKISGITVKAASDSVAVGDELALEAYGVTSDGEILLDSSMVTYTALSGFDGMTATETGNHKILAEYKDYSGKTKYGIIEIEVSVN